MLIGRECVGQIKKLDRAHTYIYRHDRDISDNSVVESIQDMGASLKQIYEEQGFVIVPDLVPADSRVALEEACERAIARTRSGSWTLRRTVGRQFPPYGDDDPDSWGVQHVMHPDLGEPVFAQWYTSDALIDVVTELLDCKGDELQMGE